MKVLGICIGGGIWRNLMFEKVSCIYVGRIYYLIKKLYVLIGEWVGRALQAVVVCG